jgi:hypothetical protein
MADITVTAAQVRRVYPDRDEVYDFTAGVAITAGAAVYVDTTTGKLGLADASAAGTAQVRGIALNSAAAGETVAVLMKGVVAGFTLAGDYDSRVYLSNTDSGILGDAAGVVSVIVGRVIRANDSSATKLLLVNTNILTQYA